MIFDESMLQKQNINESFQYFKLNFKDAISIPYMQQDPRYVMRKMKKGETNFFKHYRKLTPYDFRKLEALVDDYNDNAMNGTKIVDLTEMDKVLRLKIRFEAEEDPFLNKLATKFDKYDIYPFLYRYCYSQLFPGYYTTYMYNCIPPDHHYFYYIIYDEKSIHDICSFAIDNVYDIAASDLELVSIANREVFDLAELKKKK